MVLQIQQLEEHLEQTKEEVNQLKSDLQENVELVSRPPPNYYTLGLQKSDKKHWASFTVQIFNYVAKTEWHLHQAYWSQQHILLSSVSK